MWAIVGNFSKLWETQISDGGREAEKVAKNAKPTDLPTIFRELPTITHKTGEVTHILA